MEETTKGVVLYPENGIYIDGLVDMGLPKTVFSTKIGEQHVHVDLQTIINTIEWKRRNGISEYEARQGVFAWINYMWYPLNSVIVLRYSLN